MLTNEGRGTTLGDGAGDAGADGTAVSRPERRRVEEVALAGLPLHRPAPPLPPPAAAAARLHPAPPAPPPPPPATRSMPGWRAASWRDTRVRDRAPAAAA